MLKKFLIGTFALALMLTFAASVSAFSGATLRQGSKGADVMELQTKLGLTADGSFGPMTKAAVMAFQASNGLTADGIAGPMTLAKMTATTPAVGGTLPAGCVSTSGFSSTTGKKCDGTEGGTTPTGPLQGGAGDVTISSTSSDVEDTIKESDENAKVLGFKVEAEDSDVAVTSLKVVLKNNSYAVSSEKLTDYVDSVTIFMGSTEVGSADASDFSKDTGTPDEYSKSITLSNAVVREGDEAKFYVAVSSVSNVDSDDMDADWYVLADTLRFQDSTGVIMTADVTESNIFDFEDASTDDSLEVKSSTNNPEDGTVKVDENDTTDDVLALAFKMDVDEDSADVTVTSMKVTVAVTDFDSDNDGDITSEAVDLDSGDSPSWVEGIVDSVMIEIDGESYEADLDDASSDTAADLDADGDGEVTYTVTFEDEEMVIDSGDVVEAKVMLNFNDQDGNYNEDVVVAVSLADEDDIEAETENDELDVDGSGKTGADLTLSLSSANVSSYDWTVNTTGTIVDFIFKVEATDSDFDVLVADITEAVPAGTATVTNPGSGVETTQHGILSRLSGDSVVAIAADAGFTVAEGDTTTFRLRYTISGSNGTWKEFTVTNVAGQEVPDDDETSPTATLNVPN